MIGTDNRPFEQGPCVLNAVCVHIPAHVFFGSVVDRFVFGVVIFDAEIRWVLVRVNLLCVRLSGLSNELSNDLLAWVFAALLAFIRTGPPRWIAPTTIVLFRR